MTGFIINVRSLEHINAPIHVPAKSIGHTTHQNFPNYNLFLIFHFFSLAIGKSEFKRGEKKSMAIEASN